MVGLLRVALLEELYGPGTRCQRLFSSRSARAFSGLAAGVTDRLDLLLEVAVCFLGLGGFAAGLFGIELQSGGALVPCVLQVAADASALVQGEGSAYPRLELGLHISCELSLRHGGGGMRGLSRGWDQA